MNLLRRRTRKSRHIADRKSTPQERGRTAEAHRRLGE